MGLHVETETRRLLASPFLSVKVGEAGSCSWMLQNRKAREISPGSLIEAERRTNSMVHILVKVVHVFFGQITVLILWRRSRRRK